MVEKITPCDVPYVSVVRPAFPNLDKVLDGFVLDNSLPAPKTVVDTASRGIIVSFGNGDLINIYSSSEDLNSHYQEIYGLEGRLDGTKVQLIGAIRVPSVKDWHGKRLKKETVRYDENKEYSFLGAKLQKK